MAGGQHRGRQTEKDWKEWENKGEVAKAWGTDTDVHEEAK